MNRTNLKKLAKHLKKVPQHKFTMSDFRTENDYFQNECKTAACAAGYIPEIAPDFVIRFFDSKRIDFGETAVSFTGINISDRAWDWLFRGDWSESDNTPTGAALRIEWLLKNGVPDNWYSQMTGNAPLCYYE